MTFDNIYIPDKMLGQLRDLSPLRPFDVTIIVNEVT